MFVHSGECVFGNPHNDMVYLRTVGIHLKSMLIKRRTFIDTINNFLQILFTFLFPIRILG